MSDRSEPAEAAEAGEVETADWPNGERSVVRLVLGVALLFALLGGLLVRIAAGAALDGFLGGALAVLALTAAGAVFGRGPLRAAADLLRP